MYQEDKLVKYIEESELRVFSKSIKIRLSKELAIKYDKGCFTNELNNIQKCFDKLKTLNIKYPGNANPIFYVYIVPMKNYAELLRIPKIFDNGKGGGKPVRCIDLDGFNDAYGISENLLEDRDSNISMMVNQIHELTHIINSQFCQKNQSIHEGFAEAIPLYVLDMEDKFKDHKESLIKLKEKDIYSMQELLNSEKNHTYGEKALLPNKSCSFRLSYISSYLFVRGCISKIQKNRNCSKIDAVQKFLEILKCSNCTNEWLIYDIANAINLDKDKLLKIVENLKVE